MKCKYACETKCLCACLGNCGEVPTKTREAHLASRVLKAGVAEESRPPHLLTQSLPFCGGGLQQGTDPRHACGGQKLQSAPTISQEMWVQALLVLLLTRMSCSSRGLAPSSCEACTNTAACGGVQGMCCALDVCVHTMPYQLLHVHKLCERHCFHHV